MKKLIALILVLALCVSLGVAALAAEGAAPTGGNTPADRSMAASVLWVMAGQPVVNYAPGFEDLDPDAIYMDAVRWAASEGIVKGYNEKTFGPDDPITREQLAVMIYRYAQMHGLGFTGAWSFPLNNPDAADVSPWADEATHWMLMNAAPDAVEGLLLPKATVTRKELGKVIAGYICGVGADTVAYHTIRLGTTPYTVRIPNGFTAGALTEAGQVACWRSNLTDMEFDVYQLAKTGEDYAAAEAAAAGTAAQASEENGIPTVQFHSVDRKTLTVLVDAGAEYLKLVFRNLDENSNFEAHSTLNCLEKTTGTVGIAMPVNASDRWTTDAADLKEQFEAAGYKVMIAYTDSVSGDQDADVLGLIAQGADLLLIAAVDSDGLSRSMAAAGEKGIPVVAYDRLINGTDAVSAYVTYDSYVVGKMQGECIRDALDLDTAAGPFNIEYAAGSPTDRNADYVFRGAMDVLKPYIDAGKLVTPSGQTSFDEVATLHWRDEEACARFTRILAEHYADGTRLDAVLCGSDNVAHGVGDALAAGYTVGNLPVITGQDANPDALRAIADGRQTMTVYKDFAAQAAVAFAVSEALLEGKPLGADLDVAATFDAETYHNDVMAVPTYLLTPDLITAENVAGYMDADLDVAGQIVGTWMIADRDGEPALTNGKRVYTFVSGTEAYMSASLNSYTELGEKWLFLLDTDVAISGNKMTLVNHPDEQTTTEEDLTITTINDGEFTANRKFFLTTGGNEVLSIEDTVRFVKVDADYSESILGTWEGHCTSKNSVFDDGQDHRWEYKDDGTYVYYVKDGDNWTPGDNTLNEYFVAGNLLCTRWVDGGVENREWWEITIDGDTMTWIALRQNDDGSTYTATFEMTKVE